MSKRVDLQKILSAFVRKFTTLSHKKLISLIDTVDFRKYRSADGSSQNRGRILQMTDKIHAVWPVPQIRRRYSTSVGVGQAVGGRWR
jgi:hypothetical protein